MKIQRKPDAMTAAPMTPDELKRRLKKAKLTSGQAAALLGRSNISIIRMLAGTQPIHFLVGFAVRHL